MFKLTSDTIYLRAVEPSDLIVLYDWENDPTLWHLSNTTAPFSKHVLEQYILSAQQDIFNNKQLRLMICLKSTGAPMGCIDLFDFEPVHLRAGIGVMLHDHASRRKGYATEALSLLLEYAKKVLYLHQVYCHINADNEASLQLFQKHHFEICGNKKAWNRSGDGWVDELVLQRVF